MQGQGKEKLLWVIARMIDDFIDAREDAECPHCQKPINQITFEDIENWLKGEK